MTDEFFREDKVLPEVRRALETSPEKLVTVIIRPRVDEPVRLLALWGVPNAVASHLDRATQAQVGSLNDRTLSQAVNLANLRHRLDDAE